jgi:hypothetical protein
MNPTKQEAFEKISALVERFREHLEEYKRGAYNEHMTEELIHSIFNFYTY